MESEQRQSYTGLIPEDRVTEIDNRMLCPNVALDMNLYLESGHYYTLYIPKGTLMDKGKLGNIYNSYKPVYLFILNEDQLVFDNYVIMNLETKLRNSGFTLEEKMEHLHFVGQKIVADIFSNPDSLEYLGYANMLVPLMLDFIEEHPRKCWDLIKLHKSRNYLWSHMVNVSFLLMAFARFNGIKERKKLVDIGVGGLLHDIGKAEFSDKLLQKDKIQKVVVYGLATDYCVKATALDAMEAGYEVDLILDLCRGVSPDTTDAAIEEMEAKGVTIVRS